MYHEGRNILIHTKYNEGYVIDQSSTPANRQSGRSRHKMKSTALTVSSLLAVRRASRETRDARPTSARSRSGERSTTITARPASASTTPKSPAATPSQPVSPLGTVPRPVSAPTPSQSISAFNEVVSEDFLSCKMCFRGLVQARILRCLHTFCHECLRQRVRQINPLRAVIECAVCHTTTRVMNDGVGKIS